MGSTKRTVARNVSNIDLLRYVLSSLLEIRMGKDTSMNDKSLLSLLTREWNERDSH